jgi:hypothetical protein
MVWEFWVLADEGFGWSWLDVLRIRRLSNSCIWLMQVAMSSSVAVSGLGGIIQGNESTS